MPKKSKSNKTKRIRNRPRLRGGDSHSDLFSPLVEKAQGGGGVIFPASFANVPIRSFYQPNLFNGDPGYSMINERNTGSFYGGNKRRGTKCKGLRRKSKSKRVGGAWPAIPQVPQLRIPVSSLYDSMNPPRESI